MLFKLQSAIALFTSSCLVCVASAPSNVGFVVTNGEARVDGSSIRGNSTLFPGSFVQAGSASSDLMFPGGSNLLLQPDSAVKVYQGYAVLEKGAAVQHGTRSLVVSGLRISALSSQGSFAVGMKDASHLEVTARDGAAEVRNGAGALVAHLEPGKAFTLSIQDAQQESPAPAQPQASPTPIFGIGSQSQQITIHGILRKDHAGSYGHYLLTDVASKTTYQLQGPGLDDLVGASVEATGTIYDTTPAEGASKVLSISDVHQFASNESPAAPEAAPPAETAGPPTPAGDNAPLTSAGSTPPAAPNTAPAPEAPSTPPDATVPQPPPLVVHSDTAKIVVIVAIAAGAAVGVALGLGGGKSSTVSPE
jgi:hypothetical protein